jgi:tRNA-dihydrouridine synthase A
MHAAAEPATVMHAAMPPLSVAPMMQITDRHFRRFLRGITSHTLLYSEMITAQAIKFGDRERLLGFSAVEHPLVLQLGGSDPELLAQAAVVAEEYGYDELNLNVGCPSDRVYSGNFGACLMLQPALVAESVAALKAASSLPVTVKHRIGVDEQDSYEELLAFVDTVAAAGVERFTVHARKAWLKGLSPKENRTVPPLRYGDVFRLAQERSGLSFELNGGILTLEAALQHLDRVAAVMVGRAVADDPFMLARADELFFGAEAKQLTRAGVIRSYLPYVEEQRQAGVGFRPLTRHLLPMFTAVRGAKAWRRELTEAALRPESGPEQLLQALNLVDEAAAEGTAEGSAVAEVQAGTTPHAGALAGQT